jgi:hypothetical protein
VNATSARFPSWERGRPLLHRVAPPTPCRWRASLTESPARCKFVESSLGTFGAASGPPLFLYPQNQSPNAAMRPVGALALHTRVGPCRGTEREHHHPFLAASRSSRGFTVADFLVGITTVAVLVGALVKRDAGGSPRHISGRRHDPHRGAGEYAQPAAPRSLPVSEPVGAAHVAELQPNRNLSRNGKATAGVPVQRPFHRGSVTKVPSRSLCESQPS